LNTLVIGAGLIGTKRAEQVVSHHGSSLAAVVDPNTEIGKTLAKSYNVPLYENYESTIADDNIQAVIVCTPNKYLLPIALKALDSGKHVLIEKPMCRNYDEAKELADMAGKAESRLKIGFNHPYHPALMDAYTIFKDGGIGTPMYIRAIYGHGGRPGYDEEWRASKDICGGGELLDQGVHVIDLVQRFFGVPSKVEGHLAQWVWKKSEVEDNAFVHMFWEDGKAAQFHTSWTQWKNKFKFEIYGEEGSLEIDGLGKSYGVETLLYSKRAMQGGAPDVKIKKFEKEDDSWKLEWADFVDSIGSGDRFYSGEVDSSLAVMKTVKEIYDSSIA